MTNNGDKVYVLTFEVQNSYRELVYHSTLGIFSSYQEAQNVQDKLLSTKNKYPNENSFYEYFDIEEFIIGEYE